MKNCFHKDSVLGRLLLAWPFALSPFLVLNTRVGNDTENFICIKLKRRGK